MAGKSYLNNLGSVSADSVELAKARQDAEVFESYKAKVGKKDEPVLIAFTSVDEQGNLFRYEGDVKIVLLNEEILANGKRTNPHYRSRLIDSEYNVVVQSVDEETKTVYVSARKIISSMKSELLRDIGMAYKTKQPMIMAAKVVKFDDSNGYAVVDLYGCGVLGIVPKKNWELGYTDRFEESSVKVGDIITVKLLFRRRILPEYGNVKAQVVSRAATLANPYKGLSKKYPVGSICVLRVVQLNKYNFFGRIDGLDGVDVYCSYPGDKYFGEKAKDIKITLGSRYVAYVYEVDEENRKFRCKVFSEKNEAGQKVPKSVTDEQIRRSVAMSMVSPEDVPEEVLERGKTE